jgi:hypothetical protein
MNKINQINYWLKDNLLIIIVVEVG